MGQHFSKLVMAFYAGRSPRLVLGLTRFRFRPKQSFACATKTSDRQTNQLLANLTVPFRKREAHGESALPFGSKKTPRIAPEGPSNTLACRMI